MDREIEIRIERYGGDEREDRREKGGGRIGERGRNRERREGGIGRGGRKEGEER